MQRSNISDIMEKQPKMTTNIFQKILRKKEGKFKNELWNGNPEKQKKQKK